MTFTRVGDPHIWDEDGGESIAAAFRRHGLFFKKGDNTRLAGKMQFHYRLSFRDDGKPGMYIFRNCRDFIRTIPGLQYDPGSALAKCEDIDTRGEDHIYDETRYMLMNYKTVPQKKPKPQTEWTPPPREPLAQDRIAVGNKYVPN
jgi:hypothetical protein